MRCASPSVHDELTMYEYLAL